MLSLLRDALQHLPYRAIAGVLHQYCLSAAPFLLVGSYLDEGTAKNEDIVIGDAFTINVLLPPFSFPRPVEVLREAVPAQARKYLLLYRLDVLCADQSMNIFLEKYFS